MSDAKNCLCIPRGVIPRNPSCGDKPDDFEE